MAAARSKEGLCGHPLSGQLLPTPWLCPALMPSPGAGREDIQVMQTTWSQSKPKDELSLPPLTFPPLLPDNSTKGRQLLSLPRLLRC